MDCSTIIMIKNQTGWGCPDLDRGLRLPKPVGYQATPQPQLASDLRIGKKFNYLPQKLSFVFERQKICHFHPYILAVFLY